MTHQADSSREEFGDFVIDVYFDTKPAERWPGLCRFLDRSRASMTKATEWQREEMMNRWARAIGASLVKRDPSLQPHADALLARYPEPTAEMFAAELGWSAPLH